MKTNKYELPDLSVEEWAKLMDGGQGFHAVASLELDGPEEEEEERKTDFGTVDLGLDYTSKYELPDLSVEEWAKLMDGGDKMHGTIDLFKD